MKKRRYFRCCMALLFIVLQFVTVVAQEKEDGMYVSRNEDGSIRNAMYFKDNKPISQWIIEQNLTKFQESWSTAQILEYFNKSLEIKLVPSLKTSICLERIGDKYLENKDFINTEKLYLATTKMLEELDEKERSGYMYYYLGLLYHDWKNLQKADLWYEKALQVYDSLSGTEGFNYKIILATIIKKYISEDCNTCAIPYLKTYLEPDNIEGKSPGELLNLNYALAGELWNLNRKDEAIPYYERSIQLAKLHYGVDSKEYAELVKLTADRLYEANYKKEAEPLYSFLLEPGQKHLTTTDEYEICTRLIEYYTESMEIDKILPVLEKLEPLFKIQKIINKKGYADYASGIGLLYMRAGKYDLAEKYLEECLKIRKKSLNKTDPLIAAATVDLAMVYLKMYNVEKALLFADQAMELIKQSGKTDKYVSDLYLNINAIAFLINKKYKEAETAMLQLLDQSSRGGLYELEYAVSLGTLGTIYWYQQEYDKSKKKYLEAIDIFETNKGENLHEYANLMGNLSMVYAKTGDYNNACLWGESALESQHALSGENHPDYLTQNANLSMYLEGKGNYNEAIHKAISVNKDILSLVDRNLLYWSENEMESFIDVHINRFFDYFNSLYFRAIQQQPELAGQAYNNLLFLKGLLLQSSAKVSRAVAMSDDKKLHELTEKQKECQTKLEKLYAVPPDKRQENPAILELEYSDLQKQIKKRINSLDNLSDQVKKQLTISESNFLDVKEVLKPGQAAIEFLSFNYYDILRETDSVFYCALVLRHDFDWPEMIFLSEETKLDELLKQHPDQLYFADNQALYTTLWEPVIPYLNEIETVYYSPSGLLHRISFPAIAAPDQQTLSDKYDLFRLASTRNLLPQHQALENQTGLIFGGINYNEGVKSTKGSKTKTEPKDDKQTEGKRSLRGADWDFLPGTVVEAENIHLMLNKGNIVTSSITGEQATENAIKSISGDSPSIIHIASHGFSFPPAEQQDAGPDIMMGGPIGTNTLSKNPLMRSGLLFAGANKTWASGLEVAGAEDGILTAYEIASLDLSETEIMVLSACETGLGEVKGNEGVFGLQRAMFMAGVENMIVSLWEVPDIETIELMSLFYGNIISGLQPESAFYQAQKEMKLRYSEQPSLWAGFVFIR